MEIINRVPIEVPVNDIKTDSNNPNEMDENQLNGLRESMKRFGFLQAIIIDQNNTICDGFHRFKVYKEFGQQLIPAIRITVKNENERRLIRQTMNKIRGIHNPLKDIEELEILLKDNEEDLKALLNYTQEDLDKQREYAEVLDGEYFKKRTKEDEAVLDEIRKKNNVDVDNIDSGDFNTYKLVIEFDDEDEYRSALERTKRLSTIDNISFKDLYMSLLELSEHGR